MMLLCKRTMMNRLPMDTSYSHSDQQNRRRSHFITMKSLKFSWLGSKASHGFGVIWVCVGEQLDFQTSVFLGLMSGGREM